jgi:hypothetical protein
MAPRHLPSPDLHRLDGQPYGLRPKETKNSEKRTSEARPLSHLFCVLFRSFRLYSLVFFRSFLPEKQDVTAL